MRRSLVAGVTGLALIATACVSVTPPAGGPTVAPTPTASLASPSPSATPTPAASATPTAGATATPTTTPTGTPSVDPTATASASETPSGTATASPTGSPSTSVDFGADTEIFTDDFSDSTSGLWGVGDLAEGSIAYAEETLSVTFAQDTASLWSWRLAAIDGSPATWNTMRVEGRVILAGEGSGGWGCGDGPSDFVGGVVNNAEEWILFEIIAGVSSELDRGPLPEPIVAVSPYAIVIECAGTATGTLRLRMQVDGVEVVDYERTTGQATFDRVAAYASAEVSGFTATFDDAVLLGGTTLGGAPPSFGQPAVDELLTHVPEAFRANCTASTGAHPDALAAVTCEPAGSAGEAGYASFPDTTTMDVAYDQALAELDAPEGGLCQSGPGSGTYTIAEAEAGRLACGANDADGGIAFLWTNTQLNIVAAGLLGMEDYPALHDWWVNEAGPFP